MDTTTVTDTTPPVRSAGTNDTPTPRTDPQPIPIAPRTPEQRAAILAVAGSRPHDPTADAWIEEIARYREQIRQEEIAAQDGKAVGIVRRKK